MMLHQLALAILLTLAATTTPSVDAHGKLLKPEAKIRPDTKLPEGVQYDFVGEIEGKKAFSDNKLNWGRTPEQNMRQFTDTFAAAGYTTLRQFFQDKDAIMKPRFSGKTDNVCGFTDMATTPATLPADGVLEWGNKAGRWGFQNDHHGPCEIWCDDNLVLQNADCRAAFGKELPARMTIDVAKCAGSKRLQFLWLAVHFAKWQYWMNCVPLAATETLPPAIPTANVSVTAAASTVAPVSVVAPVTLPGPVTPVATPVATVPAVAPPVDGPTPCPSTSAPTPTVASLPVMAPVVPSLVNGPMRQVDFVNSPQRQSAPLAPAPAVAPAPAPAPAAVAAGAGKRSGRLGWLSSLFSRAGGAGAYGA